MIINGFRLTTRVARDFRESCSSCGSSMSSAVRSFISNYTKSGMPVMPNDRDKLLEYFSVRLAEKIPSHVIRDSIRYGLYFSRKSGDRGHAERNRARNLEKEESQS